MSTIDSTAQGIITTIGTVLPSLIVIVLVARFFGKFQEKPAVKSAFYGLRAGTTGMIAVAAINVVDVAVLTLPSFKASGKWADLLNWPAFALFVGVFILYEKLQWHPVFFIAIGAVFGVLFL